MGWEKTRYCYCDNCRFHKVSETGWATCPEESNPNRGKGSWLWIRSHSSVNDFEDQDRIYLKTQLKSQVIEDVRID